MSDLDVCLREHTRGFGLAEFVASHQPWRKDKLARAAAALEGLRLHANEKGQIRASLASVAHIMGQSPRSVQRGVTDLAEYGAVAVDGDLSCGSVYRDQGYEWMSQPTITVHPELRYTTTYEKLGDHRP
jgi:hypothetical protein